MPDPARLAATAQRVLGQPVQPRYCGDAIAISTAWERGSCWMFVDPAWTDDVAAEQLAAWLKANWPGFERAKELTHGTGR